MHAGDTLVQLHYGQRSGTYTFDIQFFVLISTSSKAKIFPSCCPPSLAFSLPFLSPSFAVYMNVAVRLVISLDALGSYRQMGA